MARKKVGAANYRQLTWARLVELDFDPINEMVAIARSHEDRFERFKMAEAIASYVFAKPKAIEHSFQTDHNVKVVIGGD